MLTAGQDEDHAEPRPQVPAATLSWENKTSFSIACCNLQGTSTSALTYGLLLRLASCSCLRQEKLNQKTHRQQKTDSSDDMRKVQRREKNRIAAQKSRLRQTQKADTLHLESEDLERQNAALRREIKQLTEEMKHFTSMLSSHEPFCSILTSPPPPPEVLYATHSFHQPHISSPRFQH
ncbi:basic leucine zipper transcriptional factor ATF-like isoform X1 [Agelaius phoeniceus]|uniref:basic leucine zipper transcriptional factor ATF-like isoform X1 n=1 Tax=Agelaius phoeniceus TaxID=39638 RepID=UPI004054F963